MTTTTYDVAVVGGGPAGATAAIFLGRAKLATILIDADQGMTRRAQLDNVLGFVDGITGPELVDRGHKQAQKAGAVVEKKKLTSVVKSDGGFTLTAEDGSTIHAKQILLALGVNVELAKTAGVAVKAGTEPRIKEVVVVDESGKTNVLGIWAAGTNAGTSVHVAVTSGDGARVAINLVSALRPARHVDHDVLKA